MKNLDMQKKPKIIDLFCGVGGFSLGAARAGFHVAGAIENDMETLHAHARNFPNTKHAPLDLATASPSLIFEKLGIKHNEVFGIIGGPPCQGFSAMGKNCPEDPRNTLFGRFFYYVREIQPDFFLVENVQGILGSKFSNLIKSSFSQIKDLYEIQPPIILCAKDFGAPTTRTRVFIAGFKKRRKGRSEFTMIQDMGTEHVNVKDALSGLPRKLGKDALSEKGYWKKILGFPTGIFGEKTRGMIPEGVGCVESIENLQLSMKVSGFLGTKHTAEVVERFAQTRQGEEEPVSRYRRLAYNGFCPTLRAGTGKDRGSFQAARPIHPQENRVITTREAARLQGFPDWFVFSKTKWASFRQIGNSVCPIVAENILSQIKLFLD